MSNLKLFLAAIAMLALATHLPVTAQVRQLPDTPDAPPLPQKLRVKPIKLLNMLKRPFIATTAEGHTSYVYRNEREL